MNGVFVTGTDTGVGKTMVAAGLLGALRQAGSDAVPMKPVQTGCSRRHGVWVAPDLEFSLKAAGMTPGAKDLARMAPYCFRPACSPHLAARRGGQRISLSRIRGAFQELQSAHDFVVVEGAGGVLVPLDDRRTMIDLMITLGIPVVLVARPGLGTINHTLLSIRALRLAGLDILAVVINHASPGRPGWIERDNRATLEAMEPVPVTAVLRFGLTASGAMRKLAPLAALCLTGRRAGGRA
jgi:dethiobiotin synthetase